MREQLKQLWALAFGDSEEVIDQFFDTAFALERCRSIEMEGRVAAALYWLDCTFAGEKYAYIYAVATHPDYRGRGLCRRLMEKTHADLLRQGYAGALLMPAEMPLRQMYRKMGYRECCYISEFACEAGTPVSLRAIGKEEYARLRRQYLPEGGVIQDGVTVDYLATFSQLYAGTDFVLAAVTEGEELNGIELLGNRAAAPGILAALGYARGSFRTPGKELPFAMFRPLREGVKAPDYLGLVFD